jgi:hypothetical protein
MIVPSTIFVKTCANIDPQKKIDMSAHMSTDNRVPIDNVVWLEDDNCGDLITKWVMETSNISYNMYLTSSFLKTLRGFKKMVDENIETALFIDDDIVFHKDWKAIFESIPESNATNDFVSLCISKRRNILPVSGTVYTVDDIIGNSAFWCSKAFAEGFINNLNMERTLDLAMQGYLVSNSKSLLCVPICHELSHLDEYSTTGENKTNYYTNWNDFVNSYGDSTKTTYSTLLSNYEAFVTKKVSIEAKFTELFGKDIEICKVKYILNDDSENMINILDY